METVISCHCFLGPAIIFFLNCSENCQTSRPDRDRISSKRRIIAGQRCDCQELGATPTNSDSSHCTGAPWFTTPAVRQCVTRQSKSTVLWTQCLAIDVSVLTFQAQFGSDSADSPDSRFLNVLLYKEIIWPLMIDSLIHMTCCCDPVSPRWCIVSLTQATAFLRYGASHMHHSAPDTPDSVTSGIPPS